MNDEIAYGALARSYALAAGVAKWWEVTAWNIDTDEDAS